MESSSSASPLVLFLSWYSACLVTALREIFEGGWGMRKGLTILLLLFCILTVAFPASALQYNLADVYSGDKPLLESPWLTASFEGTEKAGVVKLTMSASGLVSTEFVTEWTFNLKSNFNAGILALEYVSGVVASQFNHANNEFKAGGDGSYDVEFKFATAGSNRFNPGDTAVYLLHSTEEGFNALSFDAKSDPGNLSLGGPYVSAAHVQGIPKGLFVPTGSGWIGDPGEGSPSPVPEPGTLLLLGLGLIGIGIIMREMF